MYSPNGCKVTTTKRGAPGTFPPILNTAGGDECCDQREQQIEGGRHLPQAGRPDCAGVGGAKPRAHHATISNQARERGGTPARPLFVNTLVLAAGGDLSPPRVPIWSVHICKVLNDKLYHVVLV